MRVSPDVETTIPFPFHEPRLFTGFVTTRVHEVCHMWNMICLPFRSTWDHLPLFGGVRVAQSVVSSIVSCVLLLSVRLFLFQPCRCQFIIDLSLDVPLVSFVPLLYKGEVQLAIKLGLTRHLRPQKIRNMTVVIYSFDVFELLILPFDQGLSVLNFVLSSIFV